MYKLQWYLPIDKRMKKHLFLCCVYLTFAANAQTSKTIMTKTINPPGKRITFNGQLQRNDGLAS